MKDNELQDALADIRAQMREMEKQSQRERSHIERRHGRKKPGWGTTLLGALSEATNPYHRDMPRKFRR